MNKPLVAKQCANIDCQADGVIYPNDSVFYPTNTEGYWACCTACLDKANRLPKSLKALAVKKAQVRVNEARIALGF